MESPAAMEPMESRVCLVCLVLRVLRATLDLLDERVLEDPLEMEESIHPEGRDRLEKLEDPALLEHPVSMAIPV